MQSNPTLPMASYALLSICQANDNIVIKFVAAGLGWAACLLSAFCNNPKSKKKAKLPAPPGLPPKKIIMTNAKPKRE